MAIRMPAGWMEMSDERILEYLDTYGAAGVKRLHNHELIEYHYETVARRLRLLSKTELVERIGQGSYRITDDGMGYLDGKYDMRDVERPD